MFLLRWLVLIVLIVVGVVFAYLNSSGVSLNYYFGTQSMPLSLLLIITLIFGAILGMLSATGVILKLKRENASLHRKTKLVTEEVENLRAIPLKE